MTSIPPARNLSGPALAALLVVAHLAGVVLVATPSSASAPTITGIGTVGACPAPTVASQSSNGGKTVFICGSNFDLHAVPAVTFGGVAAVVTSNNGNEIQVIGPPHAAGTVAVVVTNTDGTQSSTSFTYTTASPPTSTTFGPTVGTSNGGDVVTFTGTAFANPTDNGPLLPTVLIGGVRAVPCTALNTPVSGCSAPTATNLAVVTPANLVGSQGVVVANPDNQAVAAGTFSYAADAAPAIGTIGTTTGTSLGGTAVLIQATNLYLGAQRPVVTFGGVQATVCTAALTPSASCTTGPNGGGIQVITPAHAAGAVDIIVANPDGQSATKTNGFTYTADTPPVITAVRTTNTMDTTPAADKLLNTLGGTGITITGTGFAAGARVTVGGVAATSVNVASATSITARVAAHAAGLVDVAVINADGQQASLASSLNYVASVQLTSLSTTTGGSNGGTAVTLTGVGLVSGAKVFFSGAAAPVTGSGGGTSLTITTPAITAPASATPADITVVNPDGTQAFLANAFLYTTAAAPTVTSAAASGTCVAPVGTAASGANGGASVLVCGTGFHTGSTKPAVTVGGVTVPPADITVTSATQLTITKTPAIAGTAGRAIQVTNPDAQASGTATTVAYTAAAPPAISGAGASGSCPTPTGAAASSSNGGAQVIVCGSGFHTGSNAKPVVTINGVPVPAADITINSATQLTIVRTVAIAGTAARAIQVTNPDLQASGSATTIAYTAASAPTFSSLGSLTGSSLGRNTLQINGGGFHTGANAKPTVTIGGTVLAPSDVAVTSSSILSVNTPAHTTGFVDVAVANPDGQGFTASGAFQYTNGGAPTQATTPVSPTTGALAGGNFVVLSGTNFAKTFNSIQFGGSSATICAGTDLGSATGDPVGASTVTGCTAPTSTTVVVVAPVSGSAGYVNVYIENEDGQSLLIPNGYRYLPAGPTVDAMTGAGCVSGNTMGGTAGGDTVKLFSASSTLGAVDTVALGGTLAPFSAATSSCLTATSGPHSAGAAFAQAFDADRQSATLRSAGNNPNLLDAFLYGQDAAPSISRLSTTSGPGRGGTLLTLTGANFDDLAGASGRTKPTVTFGGVAALNVGTPSCASNVCTLTLMAPPHAAGLVTVTITNADGVSGSQTGAFLYLGEGGLPAPTISLLAPASGPAGTTVSITGQNFVSGATVTFGGTAATTVTFNGPTDIDAVAPAHANGAVGVVVTNPDGQASNSLTYTYGTAVSTVTVTGVTPPQGSTAGLTDVTITGSGFATGATVVFDSAGTPAAATNVVVAAGGASLTARTAAHAAGAVRITVTNTDTGTGTSANAIFTYVTPTTPTLQTINPTSGPVAGGTVVTLTGTNLASTSVVRFDGLTATMCTAANTPNTGCTAPTSTVLTVITPAHAAGDVDVSVTNTNGESTTRTDFFAYTGSTPTNQPTITTVSPTSGSTVGGTVVTITGTNFASGATVTFGGTAGTSITVTGTTTITVTTPAHAAGAVDVRVTVGSNSAVRTAGFTFVAGITDEAIAAANAKVVVTVERNGNDNVVTIKLPKASEMPAAPTGVDLFRSLSPFTLIKRFQTPADAVSPEGTLIYTDVGAPAAAKYQATVFYGSGLSNGQSTCTPSTTTTTECTSLPPGFNPNGGTAAPAAAGGFGDWLLWLLIGLGVLLLIIIIIVVIAVARKKGEPEPEPGAWPEAEPEQQADEWAAAPAADAAPPQDEWAQAEPQAEEIPPAAGDASNEHNARCPACSTQFTVAGEKPIVTVCPGCGKKGILR